MTMMAIGDSLFNGVRSLTINQQLAQWSAPAQVARALGIPFVTPDYPCNVVMNFEEWLRRFPDLIGIAADLESNIKFWNAVPKSSLGGFDNIAIASTTYADMWQRSAATAQTELAGLAGALGGDLGQIGAHAADLFFAFNTRFLLNPQDDPAQAGKSSLDIVAARRPQRLLVSIGANNGLWEMGFAATASSGTPGGAAGTPFDAQDVADLTELVDRLARLPAEVEHIYINALPLPSAVANMMPVPDVSDTHKPGAEGYYPRYENRFGFNYATLTAAQMAANNATVRAMNARLRDAAHGIARIHVVPIDDVFMAYDFKTNPAAQTIAVPGKTLSNLMLEGHAPLFPDFWRGGLMGLDGMHPTLVGYAVMAQTILGEIRTHEGIVSPLPPVIGAYQADSLLQNVPLQWDVVLDLSLDIRRATATGPTGLRYGAVSSLLSALHFKID
jgi:lysophospholipase L1-like esterase